ncbi:hypothetical protein ACFC6U_40940 [Kitasatospora purpeofusca]|uniref:hypothetical protein n=1 Tax=Kitasatospora purpeofusca TaxID=67352 RepID=UPI0035D88BEA
MSTLALHTPEKPVEAAGPGAPALPAPLWELPAGLSYRAERVAYHGPHREFVAPGRFVVLIDGESPWATARPEECLNTSNPSVWIADYEVLVCLSCGLDDS